MTTSETPGPKLTTHTHTHTRYAWRPHTRTNQETHQKDVDDIIYDGFNWWWCNSEPTLSETCPLQKHSSHYNNIKGNLEEAASLLEGSKMYWNLKKKKKKKKTCGLVFSTPHFCFGAPLAFPEVQQVLWKHCREEYDIYPWVMVVFFSYFCMYDA